MIGIALSGGGARGIAHLGVLKALKEGGIEAGMFSGASAGAIIGSFIAAGISPEECLEIIKKTKILSIPKPSYSWKGLLSIEKLGKVLESFLPKTFEDLQTPLIIATTEINKGETEYFDKGELVLPILASSCIPVIFKPVLINGGNYVDGGILNNLPAEPLKSNVDYLIGISCNPAGYIKNLNNARLLMERSALLAINGNTAKSRLLCDYIIEPPELVTYSGFKLSQADDLFAAGYKFASTKIEEIKSTSDN
jgi:NTE family protein